MKLPKELERAKEALRVNVRAWDAALGGELPDLTEAFPLVRDSPEEPAPPPEQGPRQAQLVEQMRKNWPEDRPRGRRRWWRRR